MTVAILRHAPDDASPSYARPVSIWRRKALEAFPELGKELTSDEIDSTYAAWREVLLPLAAEAHGCGDDELLKRIFEYAAWSARRPAKHVWNAVGVGFYEHLFEISRSAEWMRLVVRLTPRDVLDDVSALWDNGALPESDLARLRAIRARRDPR